MIRSLVLLDVGSTNSRAWLVEDGRIVNGRTAPVGVRNSAAQRTTTVVADAVRELIDSVDPRREAQGAAAAGMIGSAQGLRDVPHVPAPATVDDLARGSVLLERGHPASLPLLIVPGVRTPRNGDGVTEDVMRGEETLTAGLLFTKQLDAGERLLNAGSHWKLITIDGDGRIAASRTSLGGEVVHAVQTSTLLAASLPDGPLASVDTTWLDAGATAVEEAGLLRAFFAVRLLDQRGETSPAQRFSWLIGACIQEDARALLRSGALAKGESIAISGAGSVPAAWAHVLQRHGCSARVLPATVVEQAFVAGLWCIASLRSDAFGERRGHG